MHRIRHRVVVRLAATMMSAGTLMLLTSIPASAAPSPPPAVNDVPTVVDNTRFWIMGVLGGVASLFACIGAARYMLAGGDPGELERAKGSFKSAGVGYALAVLSPVLITILNSILRP